MRAQEVAPARPKWKKPGTEAEHAPTIHFSELPSHTELGASWDECMDALVHVGGGTIGSFERVATQAEGSSLFVDGFLRTLETLGQIDVRRDSALQPKDWEANPAYLAETLHDGFVLAGVWSSGSRDALGKALDAIKAASWFLRGRTTNSPAGSSRGVDADHLDCAGERPRSSRRTWFPTPSGGCWLHFRR